MTDKSHIPGLFNAIPNNKLLLLAMLVHVEDLLPQLIEVFSAPRIAARNTCFNSFDSGGMMGGTVDFVDTITIMTPDLDNDLVVNSLTRMG